MKHLTTRFGETHDNKCLKCGARTVLVIASRLWTLDSEGLGYDDDPGVIVSDDITGHYCRKCWRLTSLSFNGANDA